MEMRSFFSFDSPSNYIISNIKIDPSRSPFIQDRLEVLYEENSIDNIKKLVKDLEVNEATFKVVCLNNMEIDETKKIPQSERRLLEREIGLCIEGEPDLNHPEIIFGVILIDGKWYFGKHMKSVSIWLKHLHKPHSYSTALSTRVARTVANIAVPQPQNIRAIDPCCGIGTVVIEALSMGINIEGRDINYNVCQGSRKNITYFGLTGNIILGPISEVKEHYDVAIIDLPYNLFTHTSTEDQFNILKHARRIADKVVVVTIETIDDMIEDAGFVIADRCIAKKQSFLRQILLCE
ncbi:RNA methyltransferase [Lysinibacillus agricola]|uniref:RNA methyltransferase n=2 Tax=Lysinibacillus agricola TaxID=2590012 RepID=A0ABX7AYK7_9BACI|nr:MULTISPECIES: RNA methyltransferase [Lysinibacillus]QQP14936.1 RNA methyltransferase [Lysinibacillus agricola]